MVKNNYIMLNRILQDEKEDISGEKMLILAKIFKYIKNTLFFDIFLQLISNYLKFIVNIINFYIICLTYYRFHVLLCLTKGRLLLNSERSSED